MTTTLLQSLLLFFISQLGSMAIATGGWDSNGGDRRLDQNNPWFFNDPVGFCVDVSPESGLDQDQAHKMVLKAVQKWSALMNRKGLLTSLGEPHDRYLFRDLTPRKISSIFRFLGPCSISENTSSLKVYFGIESEDVKQEISIRGSDLLGLALRKTYDHAQFDNSGVIWIKNFSTDPKKIFQVLLHEFGHVFGFSHDSVHIMSQNINDFLADDQCGEWGEIESEVWPFSATPHSAIHVTKCLSPQPNSQIPSNILSELDWKQDEHFQAFVSLGLPDLSDIKNFQHPLTLTFKSLESNRRYEAKGYLQWKGGDPQWGPSIWTQWFDSVLQKYVERTISFIRIHRPSYGSLVINNKKYGVTLRHDYGIDLALFDPDQGSWWFIDNIYRQKRLLSTP